MKEEMKIIQKNLEEIKRLSTYVSDSVNKKEILETIQVLEKDVDKTIYSLLKLNTDIMSKLESFEYQKS